MARPAASQAIRAASVWTVEHAGTKTLKILVMVNTKRSSLLKTAIASSASCWREPFFLKNSRGNIRIRSLANGKRVRRPERAPGPGHFFLILRRERASKRASREGGPEVHELVSEQAYERFASR